MSKDYHKHLYKQFVYRGSSGRPHTLSVEYECVSDSFIIHDVWLVYSVGYQRVIKPTEDMLLFISQHFFKYDLNKVADFLKTQLKGIVVREAHTKVI